MKSLILTMLFIVTIGFLLVGCGSITLPGGENGEETKIDLKGLKDGEIDVTTKNSEGEEESFEMSASEDGTSFTTTTEDGGKTEGQVGGDVSLPEDYPSDVPFPDDMKLLSVNKTTQDGMIMYTATFESQQDIKDVSSMYKEYAENNGYFISLEQDLPDQYMLIATEDEEGGENSASLQTVIQSFKEDYNRAVVTITIPEN